MTCDGFMVRLDHDTQNPFDKSASKYVNCQADVFCKMTASGYPYRNDGRPTMAASCSYNTELRDQCMVAGSGFLDSYECSSHASDSLGQPVDITALAVVVVLLFMGWAVFLRRK